MAYGRSKSVDATRHKVDSLHRHLTSQTTMPKMKRKNAVRKTTKLVPRTRLLSMGLSNLYQGLVKIGSHGRSLGAGGSGNLIRSRQCWNIQSCMACAWPNAKYMTNRYEMCREPSTLGQKQILAIILQAMPAPTPLFQALHNEPSASLREYTRGPLSFSHSS
jgi:hypothetical protein